MKTSCKKPELVAPAGDPFKLKTALLYGADAVYLSGDVYGLRARADNFGKAALQSGIAFAHSRGARVYVTLNAFLHDQDCGGLDEYCRVLEDLGADAVVVSDLGVLRQVRRVSALPIHLSTQASCLNSAAAALWKELGVKRIILGREVSSLQAAGIRDKVGVEVEVFVHGALCMAYGGRCVISNFTVGRDANRGGCVHSCRFNYDQAGWRGHTLSSKDLCAAECFPQIARHGLDAFKIEGRMKSLLYVAAACRAYRRLIDAACSDAWEEKMLCEAQAELASVPHRPFCTGSLNRPAGLESVCNSGGSTTDNASRCMVGVVLEKCERGALVRLFEPLRVNQELELVPFQGARQLFKLRRLCSIRGEDLSAARQDQVVLIPAWDESFSLSPCNLLARIY
ncbi:MAG: U32 family peptidase [Deltaproteobacteria bacterium]|nr:U32 family peptidase [Deltaproteobacteria bacterium]